MMIMRALVIPYAFLISSAVYILITLALGRFTLPREQFRLMNYAGLANAICGVFSYFLEDNYWMPHRWGGFRLGIEDFLIAYAVGMIPWYLVAFFWKKKLRVNFQWPGVIKRFLLVGSISFTYLLGVWMGVNPMTALLVICGAVVVALLCMRPGNWPLALTGMIAFSIIWFFVVALTFWALPDFIFQWNLAGQWGRPLFGVPVGEIVWAVVFGAALPLLTGIVFNVRIDSKKCHDNKNN